MNHTTLATAVGMLAIVAALIGAVVSVLPAAHAQSYTSNDPSYDKSKDPGKKNSIDIENSQTDFSFKQKLKNNCSGFALCTNTATETLAGV